MWYSGLRLLAACLFSQDPTSVSDSRERERKGGYDEKGTRVGACQILVSSPGVGVDFGEKTTFMQGVRLQPGAICALSLFSVYPLFRRGFFPFSPGTPVFLSPSKRQISPNIKLKKKLNKNPLIADQSNIYSCALPVGNV